MEPTRNIGHFFDAFAREGAIAGFDLVRQLRARGHRMHLYAPAIHETEDPDLWRKFDPLDHPIRWLEHSIHGGIIEHCRLVR